MSETSPKRNPNGAGRKTLLTPEVQREFFVARAMGLSLERSAHWAGVSDTSIRNWRTEGQDASSIPASKRTPMEQKCVEFLRALERVDNEWIMRCEMVLNFSMTPGQNAQAWKNASNEDRRLANDTAKWKLSHQAPGEYSTQTRTELTGKDSGPVDLALANGEDVFKILLDAKAYEDAQDADN
jgi:hypothetical protein